MPLSWHESFLSGVCFPNRVSGLQQVTLCHKDVLAVSDNAIVLRAESVDTLDAEPTALGPAKDWNKKIMKHSRKTTFSLPNCELVSVIIFCFVLFFGMSFENQDTYFNNVFYTIATFMTEKS